MCCDNHNTTPTNCWGGGQPWTTTIQFDAAVTSGINQSARTNAAFITEQIGASSHPRFVPVWSRLYHRQLAVSVRKPREKTDDGRDAFSPIGSCRLRRQQRRFRVDFLLYPENSFPFKCPDQLIAAQLFSATISPPRGGLRRALSGGSSGGFGADETSHGATAAPPSPPPRSR